MRHTKKVFSTQEVAKIVAAELKEFINWLYEVGPSPDSVPREKLVEQYVAWGTIKYLADHQGSRHTVESQL